MIGIDLLHTGELDRLMTSPRFRAYIFAAEELAQAAEFGPERAREFLAGRFAGKEAALKALGCGIRKGLAPSQVAILREDSGAPTVRLTGKAAQRAAELGVTRVNVSIAHKGDLVIAVSIAERGGTPDEPGARTQCPTSLPRASACG
jgi:holo-[acyl-carrier protein] synthase